MEIPRVAVVATHNRPAELARLLDAIAPQCHAVMVIDNASTPPVDLGGDWWPPARAPWDDTLADRPRVMVIRDEEQPPNLSRLWNVGLDAAREYVRGGDYIGHDVAVLGDDTIPPLGWWDAVSTGMRAAGAAAACSDPYGTLTQSVLKVTPDTDLMTRMAGWAYMLRGEAGLRLDETMRWWWSDTDLDWRARAAGGMLVVPGHPVPNTGANTSTVGLLAEQAGRDRLTFAAKWGRNPW